MSLKAAGIPRDDGEREFEIGSEAPRAKAYRNRSLALVDAIFPRLAERRKQLPGTISGREQQMPASDAA